MAVYVLPLSRNVIECHLMLDHPLRDPHKRPSHISPYYRVNLASTQALACSDEILDTVGVFARL